MKRFILVGVFLFAILAFGLVKAQEGPPPDEGDKPAAGPMERYLPSDTMVYLKFRDASALPDYFKKSPLFRIWEEKDIQDALKEQVGEIEKSIKKGIEEFEKDSGLNVDDILATIKGELTFALIDFDVKSMMGANPPKLQMTLSLEPGDKKDEFQKILDAAQKAIMDDTGERGPRSSTQMYKNQKVYCFGDAQVMLSATWLGPKWVFSWDRNTLNGIIDRYLSGGIATNSLESNKDFAAIRAKCGGTGGEFFVYTDTGPLLKRMEDSMPEDVGKIYANLGLFEEMKSGYGAVIEKDGASREFSCLITPEKNKVLSLMGGTKIDTRLLIPSENIILWLGGGFDLTAQYNYMMNLLASVMREQGEDLVELLEELEGEYLGFNLEEEFVKAISKSSINFYIMLPEGGGAFPEMALTAGIADEKLIKQAIEKFADKMGEGIKSTGYQGRTIYYFSVDKFAGEDNEVPYWPSFSLAGGKLLAASSPQVLKRMIGNIEKPLEPSGEIKKALAAIPEGAYEFAYADTKKGFSYLYNTLIPYMFKKHKDDMPDFLDPATLPPVEVFTKHLSFVYMFAAKGKNGAWSEIVSPSGPITLPLAGAFLGASIAMESGMGGMGGFGGNRTAMEETAAIATLRTLSSTQELFNTRYGNYAGGLRALAEKNFIDKELATGVKYNYMFEMKAEGPDKWHCIARPLTPGKRYFFIDETGVIRLSNTPDIGPKSKSLGD